MHVPGAQGTRCLSFPGRLPSLAENSGGRSHWYWMCAPSFDRNMSSKYGGCQASQATQKWLEVSSSRVHGPGTRWSTHEDPSCCGAARTAEGGIETLGRQQLRFWNISRDSRSDWSSGCGRQCRSRVEVSHRQRSVISCCVDSLIMEPDCPWWPFEAWKRISAQDR